jgi:hypothetical protein
MSSSSLRHNQRPTSYPTNLAGSCRIAMAVAGQAPCPTHCLSRLYQTRVDLVRHGIGGGGGIRTHGGLAPTAVFKTAALSRSATPPWVGPGCFGPPRGFRLSKAAGRPPSTRTCVEPALSRVSTRAFGREEGATREISFASKRPEEREEASDPIPPLRLRSSPNFKFIRKDAQQCS